MKLKRAVKEQLNEFSCLPFDFICIVISVRELTSTGSAIGGGGAAATGAAGVIGAAGAAGIDGLKASTLGGAGAAGGFPPGFLLSPTKKKDLRKYFNLFIRSTPKINKR